MAERKCDCCGKIGKVTVASSGLGPVTLAYCDTCLNGGYEPYGILLALLVSMCDSYEDLPNAEIKALVDKHLIYYSKTKETFNSDMEDAKKSFRATELQMVQDSLRGADDDLIVELAEAKLLLAEITSYVLSNYNPENIKSNWYDTGNLDDAYDYGYTNATTHTLHKIAKLIGLEVPEPDEIEQ